MKVFSHRPPVLEVVLTLIAFRISGIDSLKRVQPRKGIAEFRNSVKNVTNRGARKGVNTYGTVTIRGA